MPAWAGAIHRRLSPPEREADSRAELRGDARDDAPKRTGRGANVDLALVAFDAADLRA